MGKYYNKKFVIMEDSIVNLERKTANTNDKLEKLYRYNTKPIKKVWCKEEEKSGFDVINYLISLKKKDELKKYDYFERSMFKLYCEDIIRSIESVDEVD